MCPTTLQLPRASLVPAPLARFLRRRVLESTEPGEVDNWYDMQNEFKQKCGKVSTQVSIHQFQSTCGWFWMCLWSKLLNLLLVTCFLPTNMIAEETYLEVTPILLVAWPPTTPSCCGSSDWRNYMEPQVIWGLNLVGISVTHSLVSRGQIFI